VLPLLPPFSSALEGLLNLQAHPGFHDAGDGDDAYHAAAAALNLIAPAAAAAPATPRHQEPTSVSSSSFLIALVPP
jgi:hypothetical protein